MLCGHNRGLVGVLLLYQELHGTTSIQQDLSVSSLRHMAAGHPQTQ